MELKKGEKILKEGGVMLAVTFTPYGKLYLTNKRLVYESEESEKGIEIPLRAIRAVHQAKLGPLKLNQMMVIYGINKEKNLIFQPVLTGRSTILEGSLSEEWAREISKAAKLD
jgi:hypothetical protein